MKEYPFSKRYENVCRVTDFARPRQSKITRVRFNRAPATQARQARNRGSNQINSSLPVEEILCPQNIISKN